MPDDGPDNDEPGKVIPHEVMIDALSLLADVFCFSDRLDDAVAGQAESFAAGGDLVDRLAQAHSEGRSIPRNLILSATALFMYSWFALGAENVFRLPWEPKPVFEDGDDQEPDLSALGCVRALALVKLEDDASVAAHAASKFLALARVLGERGRWDQAARAAAVAANVAPADESRAKAHREGVRAAARAGDRELVAVHLAGLAIARVRLSVEHPEDARLRAEAFTALEASLRQSGELGGRRDDAAPLLRVAVQALGEPIFRSLLAFALTPDDINPLGLPTDVADAARLFIQPIWDRELADMLPAIPMIASMAAKVEDFHFVPPQEGTADVQLEASWTTGRFDHPRYRQAIPHGRSLYREGNLDTILFELVHETTHIVCMLGGLGAAVSSLRAAALELEATLWSHAEPDQRDAFKGSLVAPLKDTTALALAQAEQALEPVRCMRILQRVWNPWLEGVAVFAELASDPSEGDVSSLIGDVLVNLVDVGVPSGIEGLEAIEDLLVGARAETEAMYGEVLRRSARPRLRLYLGDRWEKYGPGYLAVRAVVSTWRHTLGRPIGGTEAMRILLHVSRYGTHDAVPPLDAGSHRFTDAATSAMVAWVRRLAFMSRDDLEYVRAVTGPWGWRNGKVLREDEGLDSADHTWARYLHEVRVAWSVHRGPAADHMRVPGADPTCRYVMEQVAEALSLARPREDLARIVGSQLDAQSRLLPIGTMRTTFWLNRRTGSLLVPLRTTESDKDHGAPGYDLIMLPLDDEQVSHLAEQIALFPEERMSVTRIADLAPAAVEGSSPMAGLQVVVYTLGDWIHLQPAGLSSSWRRVPEQRVFDEVRARLSPSTNQHMEEEVCEGQAAAARTVEWISSARTWHQSDQEVPIGAWAERVHELARHVRDRDDELDIEWTAGEALVRDLWGDAPENLVDEGLELFTFGEAARLSRIIDVLLESGRRPVVSHWLDDLPEEDRVGILLRGKDGWDVRPLTKEQP